MKSSSPGTQTQPLAYAIFLALTLLPISANAIFCPEYLIPTGNPSFYAIADEVDSKIAVKVRSEANVVLSRKPKLKVDGQGNRVLLMPGEQAGDLGVIAVEGPRPPYRPDGPTIVGFWRAEPNLSTGPTTPNPIYAPKSKMLIFGSDAKSMRTVFLETNETVVANAVLDPLHQIVVTSRADRTIGFQTSTNDLAQNLMIEVYQLDPGGYSVYGFRVASKAGQTPVVRILSDGKAAFYMTVDDLIFHLDVVADPREFPNRY